MHYFNSGGPEELDFIDSLELENQSEAIKHVILSFWAYITAIKRGWVVAEVMG